MKTLNQIKETLKYFFKNHEQLNTTVYGDDFDFQAEREIKYPVAHIEYLNSIAADKTNTHSYRITLSDLVDQNLSGHEDEILSDMMLIAEDLYTWAADNDGFIFIKNIAFEKFLDDAHDRTSGIVFNIQLATIMRQNTCAIPNSNSFLE
ncbi:MAG: hypothetical protein Q7T76_09040 [Ferruginibacter sp.]|nr:hypothetical protein [Ferruginibacter sp.]